MATQVEIIQTKAVDINSEEFKNWYYQNLNDASAEPILQKLTQDSADPILNMLPRDYDGDIGDNYPDPSTGTSTGTSTPTLTTKSFYAYANYRPDVDWNTCGQAAIATMLDYHNRDPFGLPRYYGRWNSGAIIDRLKDAGWGPDVVFGWGTTGGRIADALRNYGMSHAYVEASGLFGSGREQWDKLKYFLRNLQTPVPVLIDMGMLNSNQAFTAHWPVAYKIGSSDEIYLGNCYYGRNSIDSGDYWTAIVDRDTFLKAWNCRFLPLGFNYCAVYYWGAWG